MRLLTATDICNYALLQLGNFEEIQNIATDTSKPARVLRRLYDTTLDGILSNWAWPFATVFMKAPLVSFWPTPEWMFSYQYPNDCLHMTRIWNYKHTDDNETKIEMVQSNNGSQRLLLTNYGPAQLLPSNPWQPQNATSAFPANGWPVPIYEYVQRVSNVSLMPEMFKHGFAFALAALAAPSLPGIGTIDLRKTNLELANSSLHTAGAQNLNEIHITPERRSMIQRAGSGFGGQRVPYTEQWNPVPENWPT